MKTIALEEAQRDLLSIVRNVAVGDPIILTDHGQPIAQVSAIDSRVAARSSLLTDHPPASVGRFLRPFPQIDDDLMGEMLEREG